MRKFLIALLLILIGHNLVAQKYDWYLNGQIIKGFTLKHNRQVAHLATSNPSGVELSFQQKLNGRREWESLYNKPTLSYGLSYYNLHKPALGHLLVASASIDLPLIRTENTALFFRIGTGLIFSTNPYDRDSNSQNNMMSSIITVLLQPRITYEINLTENLKLTPNLNITHGSNGGINVPNRGINIITANLGASYRIKQAEENSPKEVQAVEEIPYQVYFLASGGLNTKTRQVRQRLPFFNLFLFAQKSLTKKSDLGIGLEYSHSYSLKKQIEMDWFRQFRGEEIPDFKRFAILIGHELKFGKVGFITQVGAYVYNPSNSNTTFYHRWGLRYQIEKNLMAQIAFKVHIATAEQIELGLGWRF